MLGLACVVLVATGCPDRSVSPFDTTQSGVYVKTIPVSADIDILFVIDNSASTRDKQALFARNYVNFVRALDGFPDGRPNLHVGVVTSTVDIGEAGGAACHPVSDQNGILQNASRDPQFPCAAPTKDRFLVDVAQAGGGRATNYQGTLDQALSCISHVGDGGCGFEAPLAAMKRALDGSHPENAGFLRSGAFLAVVILTDEDDCSAQPALFGLPPGEVGGDDFRCAQSAYRCSAAISPSAPGAYTGCRVRHDGSQHDPRSYAQFLTSVKDPSLVTVALIAGPASTSIATGALTAPFRQDLALLPACTTTIDGRFAIARPALRLDEFVQQFGNRGLFRTVCQDDYSAAVGDIGGLVFDALSPCLDGDIDAGDREPDAPGLQPNCVVSEFQDLHTATQVETQVPACEMRAPGVPDRGDQRACWWVEADAASCPKQSHLALHIERSAVPPPNAVVQISCAAMPR